MARPERFELPTNWFEASYSIQLSYGRVQGRDYIDFCVWRKGCFAYGSGPEANSPDMGFLLKIEQPEYSPVGPRPFPEYCGEV